jgi:predicted short-subunit dehydrogenase-like oxidoreductase (DUF2520 family)
VRNYRISFIGAGKVAGSLCLEMYKSGFEIRKVTSKSEQSCRRLAQSCNALWSMDLDFTDGSDIIIVAVPDDQIKEVLKKIKCDEKTIVVHTAGSIGLDVFPSHLKHIGVFYPLQTFSNERSLTFSQINFFIESNEPDTSLVLKEVADSLGVKSHLIKAEDRKLLHVAAVFVNNFTNFMLISGKEIAKKAGQPFDVLKPLITETVLKAFDKGPENSQTGPAVRSDKGTIKTHIKLLSFSPDLQNIYMEITKSIMRFNNKHTND